MTLKRLDQLCEWGIVALLLGVLVYGPLVIGAARPIDFVFLQGLVALALVLWSFRFWFGKNHRLLWPMVCWPVVLFVGLAYFRSQGADLEYVARHEFIRIVVYASVFLLALNNLHKQEVSQLVVFVLLTIATLTSLYAIYQFFTQPTHIWSFERPSQYLERGSGTYICPNHFAGFLELILPFGIAYLFAGRYGYTFKVFLGYGCLVILAGLAVTLSRGGWIAAAASFFVMFCFLLRKREHRIPALATIIIAVLGLGIAFQKSEKLQERVQKATEGGSSASVSTRPAIWRTAWTMWQDYPVWGVGPGHFDYRFPEYRPEMIQARPGWVHNDYLNTLVDWGIVGAAIVGSGILLLAVGLIRTRKYVDRGSKDIGSARNSNRSAFVLGAMGAGCALAVHSFFDFNLHIAANAILACVVLAIGASHQRFASGRHWVGRWPGAKLVYPVVLIGTAVFLVRSGLQTAREQLALLEGDKHPTASVEQIDALRRAAEIEPNNFETLYNLGEALRARGAGIQENSEENLEAAIQWFQAAAERYPAWAFNYVGIGMSLDHLRRFDEATPYYERAVQLDPNQHQVIAYMGWHQINLGDYYAAKSYFDRSLEIKWWDNHIPFTYNRLIESKLGIESPN